MNYFSTIYVTLFIFVLGSMPKITYGNSIEIERLCPNRYPQNTIISNTIENAELMLVAKVIRAIDTKKELKPFLYYTDSNLMPRKEHGVAS